MWIIDVNVKTLPFLRLNREFMHRWNCKYCLSLICGSYVSNSRECSWRNFITNCMMTLFFANLFQNIHNFTGVKNVLFCYFISFNGNCLHLLMGKLMRLKSFKTLIEWYFIRIQYNFHIWWFWWMFCSSNSMKAFFDSTISTSYKTWHKCSLREPFDEIKTKTIHWQTIHVLWPHFVLAFSYCPLLGLIFATPIPYLYCYYSN